MKAITFTGLPQAVIDFDYHQKELDELRKLPGVIVDAIKAVLDKSQTGGGELTIERLKVGGGGRDHIMKTIKNDLLWP